MKYFFFFLAILFFSCKKDDSIINKEEFSYFIDKNFLVKSYRFEDFSTGENYDLLDNSEIDTLYLIFRVESMYLGKIENSQNNSFGLGVDKYLIKFENEKIKISRDSYSDFSVVYFSKDLLVIEGKHLLHNQFQRISITVSEVTTPSINLQNLISRFVRQ